MNRYSNAFPAAIQWVCDERINVRDLITKEFKFDNIQEAFEYTTHNADKNIKTIVLNR